MKIQKSKAFTLVELLIVFAIIGLVAAIIIPAFGKARLRYKERAEERERARLEGAAELQAKEAAERGRAEAEFQAERERLQAAAARAEAERKHRERIARGGYAVDASELVEHGVYEVRNIDNAGTNYMVLLREPDDMYRLFNLTQELVVGKFYRCKLGEENQKRLVLLKTD